MRRELFERARVTINFTAIGPQQISLEEARDSGQSEIWGKIHLLLKLSVRGVDAVLGPSMMTPGTK